MSGRPRVGLVSASAFPNTGGIETHVFEIAPRLAAAGFEVEILTTDLTGQLPPRDVLEGVPVRRVRSYPADRDYYFAPALYRTIRRQRWDLVHCQGYHTLVPPIAMLASIRSRLPFLVTFHSGGHDSAMRNRLRDVQHAVLRPLLARAERLVAVSQFEADHFARELRLPRSRFVIIPNGAAIEAPSEVSDADAVAQRPLIVSVGRLERYKGHHRAIAAMPHVIAQLPEAQLRIAGSGPYEAELRRLAAESGVGGAIEIAPVEGRDRAAMARLLGRAGVVVLFSEYESQGIAVLEALALGRRVLVADTSALSEFARRGQARAIPLDSPPEQVGRALVEELRSPPGPPLTLPTWDECATQLAGLYEEILAGRRPVAARGLAG